MDNIEQHSVDGLSIDCESLIISLRRVPFNAFIMSRLLSDLAEAGINVDLISRTAPAKNTFDVSVILPEKELPKVRDIANNLGNDYKDIGIKINKSITRLHTQIFSIGNLYVFTSLLNSNHFKNPFILITSLRQNLVFYAIVCKWFYYIVSIHSQSVNKSGKYDIRLIS